VLILGRPYAISIMVVLFYTLVLSYYGKYEIEIVTIKHFLHFCFEAFLFCFLCSLIIGLISSKLVCFGFWFCFVLSWFNLFSSLLCYCRIALRHISKSSSIGNWYNLDLVSLYNWRCRYLNQSFMFIYLFTFINRITICFSFWFQSSYGDDWWERSLLFKTLYWFTLFLEDKYGIKSVPYGQVFIIKLFEFNLIVSKLCNVLSLPIQVCRWAWWNAT